MTEKNLPLVSIYTCVYNMSDKIHRAFNSVKNITYKNIEHIIVNDGSADNVEELINAYIKESKIPVTYIKKENGGKHTALNIAWECAKGEFAIQLDADDELFPHSISFLIEKWFEIPEEKRDKYWCVHGRYKTQFGDFVGDKYPEGINFLPLKEINKILPSISGDKIGLQKTSVLKQYRFPEPDEVKMVYESAVWKQINSGFQTWYTNEVVGVYYINEGGNLTARPADRQPFCNNAFTHYYIIKKSKELNVKVSLKQLFTYSRFYASSTKAYKKANPYYMDLSFIHKLILTLIYPLGVTTGVVHRKKYGIK